MRDLTTGDAPLHQVPVDIERRLTFHINQRHMHGPVDQCRSRPHQHRRDVLVPMLKRGDAVAADGESGTGMAVAPCVAMRGEDDEILFAILHAARGLRRQQDRFGRLHACGHDKAA